MNNQAYFIIKLGPDSGAFIVMGLLQREKYIIIENEACPTLIYFFIS